MSLREHFGFVDSRKLLTTLFEMKDEVAELRGTVNELKSSIGEVNRNITELLIPLTGAIQAIKEALVSERAAQYDPQGDETVAQNLRLAAAVVSTDKLVADADAAIKKIGNAVE